MKKKSKNVSIEYDGDHFQIKVNSGITIESQQECELFELAQCFVVKQHCKITKQNKQKLKQKQNTLTTFDPVKRKLEHGNQNLIIFQLKGERNQLLICGFTESRANKKMKI